MGGRYAFVNGVYEGSCVNKNEFIADGLDDEKCFQSEDNQSSMPERAKLIGEEIEGFGSEVGIEEFCTRNVKKCNLQKKRGCVENLERNTIIEQKETGSKIRTLENNGGMSGRSSAVYAPNSVSHITVNNNYITKQG